MNIAELKAELEKLHGSSFGWALSCCRRDREMAEEVMQMVYLKILEGKACYRGDSSLKTWLFSVIRKTAITEHRKRILRLGRFASEDQTAEPISLPIGQAKALEKSEEQKRLQQALRKLPTRQRDALHLVFYEDASLSEV